MEKENGSLVLTDGETKHCLFFGSSAFGRLSNKVNNRLIIKIQSSSLLLRFNATPYQPCFYGLRGDAEDPANFFMCKSVHIRTIGVYRKFLEKSILFRSGLLTNIERYSTM